MKNEVKNIKKTVVISKEKLDKLIFERDELKRQLSELKRLIFGVKSEKYISKVHQSQLALFENEIEKQDEEIEKHIVVYEREKAKKKKEKRKTNTLCYTISFTNSKRSYRTKTH